MSYKVKIVGAGTQKGFIETYRTAKAAKAAVAAFNDGNVGVQATYLGNTDKKARDAMMASFGLTRVKGAVSGRTYWE